MGWLLAVTYVENAVALYPPKMESASVVRLQ
jgi:hypothetical protein